MQAQISVVNFHHKNALATKRTLLLDWYCSTFKGTGTRSIKVTPHRSKLPHFTVAQLISFTQLAMVIAASLASYHHNLIPNLWSLNMQH